MRVRAISVSLAGLAAMLCAAVPQVSAQTQEPRFTWHEEYAGSSTPLGQVTILNSSVGYNFNKYFGADAGLPVYFVHPDNPLSNWQTWNNNFGDAYLDLRVHVPTSMVNYTSVITGGAPTGSFARGFSTGRATITWDNHLDRRFGRFTPFVNAGLGNTIWDGGFLYRPYRTLGFVSEFEGGSTYRVLPWVSVGASYYDVLPGGTQKIYSQIFQREPASSLLASNHGRFYQTAFETTGPSSIDRDNGYSAWLGFKPMHNLNLDVGYTRSVRYAFDTVSFRVGVDAGAVANRIVHHF